MRLRKFDNAEEAVREYGNDKAKEELEWLLKLARTNFAACYGEGTQGPDAHDAAICELNSRLSLVIGGGCIIEQVCKWLYAEAHEKCLCGAPAFITGCEHALSSGDEGNDICACKSEECPWIHHVGVFV